MKKQLQKNPYPKEYEGKWLALSATTDEVKGISDDLVSLHKKVGSSDIVFTKVARSNTIYAF